MMAQHYTLSETETRSDANLVLCQMHQLEFEIIAEAYLPEVTHPLTDAKFTDPFCDEIQSKLVVLLNEMELVRSQKASSEH
jgi:hypothetical protein